MSPKRAFVVGLLLTVGIAGVASPLAVVDFDDPRAVISYETEYHPRTGIHTTPRLEYVRYEALPAPEETVAYDLLPPEVKADFPRPGRFGFNDGVRDPIAWTPTPERWHDTTLLRENGYVRENQAAYPLETAFAPTSFRWDAADSRDALHGGLLVGPIALAAGALVARREFPPTHPGYVAAVGVVGTLGLALALRIDAGTPGGPAASQALPARAVAATVGATLGSTLRRGRVRATGLGGATAVLLLAAAIGAPGRVLGPGTARHALSVAIVFAPVGYLFTARPVTESDGDDSENAPAWAEGPW